MATKKKMLQAAAGQAGGAGLDITEVFSTYLYTGTEASTQTITNNIDLAGEGGLVWVKARDGDINHVLMDTEQGVGKFLNSNQTYAQQTNSEGIKSFNTDGFTFGTQTGVGWSNDHASWTFRKAPKFFDVVTYTGDGSSDRQISHNLGSTPGMVIVKRTAGGAGEWMINHRSIPSTQFVKLNGTQAATTSSTRWNDTDPTDTVFTVGSDTDVNASGSSYVAYLFAHNDGDGGFGPDGDQDIIKCGSYTGNGSTDGPEIDLGFEPQWVLIKKSVNESGGFNSSWNIIDNMRGLTSGGDDKILNPNSSQAELTDTVISPQANGFKLNTSAGTFNASGGTYIYMAIRRGPLAQPESGTEVFDIDTRGATNPSFDSTSSVVDFSLMRANVTSSGDWITTSRLTSPKYLETNSTNAEAVSSVSYDWMNGVSYLTGTNANFYSWMWKRAPGFFDVVAYTGDGVAGRTVSHNLGVAPEMMWVKNRGSVLDWICYHSGSNANPQDYYVSINDTDEARAGSFWGNTAPTDLVFSLSDQSFVNASGNNYISYLFATVPGVSKVGSYTGDGTTDGSKVIDCGFTSGARFVLIKPSSYADSWFVFDSVRGITVGVDPRLKLDTTDAEASYDLIDPDSSGFTPSTGTGNLNQSGETYIFYAIA